MSVSLVNEISLERRGRNSAIGDNSRRRGFQVETTSANTDVSTILGSDDIPNIYTSHPDDGNLFLVSYDTSQEEDRLHWIVICNYAPRNIGSQDAGTDIDNPTDLPAEISYTMNRYSDVFDKAYAERDGYFGEVIGTRSEEFYPKAPVLNSANKWFDPPHTIERSYLVINITRNESKSRFDPHTILRYNETINSEQETIAGISLMKFQGKIYIGASRQWTSEGIEYWRVVYEIECKLEGHNIALVDQGYHTLTGSPAESVPIKNEDLDSDLEGTDLGKQEISEPVRLDGSGGVLGEEKSKEETVYKYYQPYYATNWKTLGLPRSKSANLRTISFGT